MINTLNESQLHRQLKILYSANSPESISEAQTGNFIADILEKDGSIIEIQTGSISSLRKKILFCIEKKRKIKVVYPLSVNKTIETKDDDKIIIRKSPIHKDILSLMREVTGIYDLLLNPYFTLEVLNVSIIEERKRTESPVQTKNKRRRFPKNWIKTGKRLEKIISKETFHGKKSWKNLLPSTLKEEWTIKNLSEELTENGIKSDCEKTRIMVWLYTKMGLIEECGKSGKSKLYRIKK